MATFNLEIGGGVKSTGPAPADFYYRPEGTNGYADVAAACAAVPEPVRIGRTVLVSGVEYAWGTDTSNAGLALKTATGPDADLTRDYIRRSNAGFSAYDTLTSALAETGQDDLLQFNARFSEISTPVTLPNYVEIDGQGGYLGLSAVLTCGNYNVLRSLRVYQFTNTSAARKAVAGQNLTIQGGFWDDTPLVLSGPDNVLEDVVFAQSGTLSGYFAAGQYWLSSLSPSTTTVRLRGYAKIPQFFLDSVQPGITVEYERVLDGASGSSFDPRAVPAAKRQAVVDAAAPAVLETDEAYYGSYFYDEVNVPGSITRYECAPSAQADGSTQWKWFRSVIE